MNFLKIQFKKRNAKSFNFHLVQIRLNTSHMKREHLRVVVVLCQNVLKYSFHFAKTTLMGTQLTTSCSRSNRSTTIKPHNKNKILDGITLQLRQSIDNFCTETRETASEASSGSCLWTISNTGEVWVPVEGGEEAAGRQHEGPPGEDGASIVDPLQVAACHVRHADGSGRAVQELVAVPAREGGERRSLVVMRVMRPGTCSN